MDSFQDADALELMLTMVREKIAVLRAERFPTPAQAEALATWRRVRRELCWQLLRLEMFGPADPPTPPSDQT